MAVRDSDTSLWLHNKLGASHDLWSGGSICSQLNRDVLRNIKDCFIDLQAQVKLKLLLSFLHIPRRNVDEWKSELEEILELAQADSDQWVSMLAELLKTFPGTGMLNLDIADNTNIFTDLTSELKKLVKKHSDLGMLPLECLYLNKNAVTALVGQQIPTVKNFQLKRRPKSAALRAELLQKSNEAASNLKKNNYTPTVPIKSRGLVKRMDDTTPLRGLPSRTPPSGGFRSTSTPLSRLNSTTPLSRGLGRTPLTGRKDGGIKLLDINEQPIGFGKDAKRRKKMPEADAASEAKVKKEELAANQSTVNPPTPAAPDYAAGLVNSSSSQLPTPVVASTPAYAAQVQVPNSALVNNQPVQNIVQSTVNTVPQSIQINLQPGINRVQGLPINNSTLNTTMPATYSINTSQNSSIESVQQHQIQQQTQLAMPQQVQPNQQHTIQIQVISGTPAVHQQLINSAQGEIRRIQLPIQVSTGVPGTIPQQQQMQQQQQQQPQQVAPAAQQQKKGLSLTREQMIEAQEMFRTANKVTRPEKALILGFMAGSRENPCPHLGNVITIKLNESQEQRVMPDGLLHNTLVETLFQMNYGTGEWKRFTKCRVIEDAT